MHCIYTWGMENIVMSSRPFLLFFCLFFNSHFLHASFLFLLSLSLFILSWDGKRVFPKGTRGRDRTARLLSIFGPFVTTLRKAQGDYTSPGRCFSKCFPGRLLHIFCRDIFLLETREGETGKWLLRTVLSFDTVKDSGGFLFF